MKDSNRKKRYAQVGLGGRSAMYTRALVEQFADTCQLVALCDTNQTRMNFCNQWIGEKVPPVPTYPATDFDRMIQEQKPDWVIVTTIDGYHHQYIVRALQLGCNVVSEKPMTTTAEKCQQVLDARKATGRRMIVTFNYRYSPVRSKVRELIQNGEIGEVRSVDFNWMLDTRHGADYFRRWHRNKANSGGLLVHKATHHFDMVNWTIASRPEVVFAAGSRSYATPQQAAKLGLAARGERCRECAVSGKCPYYLDLASKPKLRDLYLQAEHEDGYYRDRCVFSETIDIEDRMAVTVRYQSGVTMSYSLNSFLPYEGYRMIVNGTKGRLESVVQETSYISGDGTVPGVMKKKESTITLYPMFGEARPVEIPSAVGGHGGGDEPLLVDVFSDSPPPDPLKRAATEIDGAYSILIGIAANRSIETNQAVRIDSLVRF